MVTTLFDICSYTAISCAIVFEVKSDAREENKILSSSFPPPRLYMKTMFVIALNDFDIVGGCKNRSIIFKINAGKKECEKKLQ